MSYKFELPIYYKIEYKTKKDKTVLVGMNYYRNCHYHLKNKMKSHYSDLVRSLLSDFTGDRLTSYRVKYKLFYKTASSDLMNVVSIIDKFVNDAFQEIGLVENDNVKFYKKCFAEVGGQDKDDPRIEIILEELE